MPDNPQLRASDDDRDRAASLLREHHAAGRLTAEEFQERLDAAYQAKTVGDISKLLADLPSIDLYRLPDESMRRMAHASERPAAVPASSHGRLSPAWRGAWASWASVSMLLFVIWLITAISNHSANGLWFLWIAGPWGAILLGRWLFGTHPSGPAVPGSGPGGPGSGPGVPGSVPPGSPVHELRAQREAERRQRRDRRGHGPREL
jgi:hypothetical protein